MSVSLVLPEQKVSINYIGACNGCKFMLVVPTYLSGDGLEECAVICGILKKDLNYIGGRYMLPNPKECPLIRMLR